ncbi:MAG: D-alanine--D-alanine ligase [bacterium]
MDFKAKRIGVLMGGLSREREVSLRSGKGVFESLKKQGYDAVDIDVGRDIMEKLKREKVEIAFVALHGEGGEDGKIQGLLEILGIPYTGSGVLASALSMDKIATKQLFSQQGIPTPDYFILNPAEPLADQCARILDTVGLPLMTKPASEGSSIAMELIKEESRLQPAIEKLLPEYPRSFVEKFIPGKELTVGILGTGADTRALPVLELVPKNEFYDYEAKYTEGMTDFHCPARISDDETRRVQEIALRAHHAIGCHGVSRVDIMLDAGGSPFAIEVNSIPGMTTLSDLPAEAKAEGKSYDELVVEILHSASLKS